MKSEVYSGRIDWVQTSVKVVGPGEVKVVVDDSLRGESFKNFSLYYLKVNSTKVFRGFNLLLFII